MGETGERLLYRNAFGLGQLAEGMRLVQGLLEPLADAVIGNAAIMKLPRQPCVVFPGLVQPQLPHIQLVKYRFEPVDVILIGMGTDDKIDPVRAEMSPDVLDQLGAVFREAAIDDDHGLLIA